MEGAQAMSLVIAVIVGIFVLGTILSGFFQLHTAEAVVVQRMGKFERVASGALISSCRGSTRLRDASICGCNNWRSTWRRKPKTTYS